MMEEPGMLSMIKKLIAFRLGQAGARGAARMLGFGRLAMLIGLVGGWRALKRHRHA
jgi:hypothetical protein